MTFSPYAVRLDDFQQEILDQEASEILVLGAPGTGKTTLLLHAMVQARKITQIPAHQMLCLTSGLCLQQGYAQLQDDALANERDNIFVGQIQDFALFFLIINGCITPKQQLLNNEARLTLVRQIFEEQSDNKTEKWETQRVVDYANRIREEAHNIPFSLRKYQYADMRFKQLAEIYLQRLDEQYLIDFDALLFMAYEKLATDSSRSLRCRDYIWIAIDEAQDFAPLHLAFIDLIKAPQAHLRFFADEHQSCCSNRGGDRYLIEKITQRPYLLTFRLPYDYRSPKQNLELLRTYAPYVAQIPETALAHSQNAFPDLDDALSIVYCSDATEQEEIIAAQARSLSEEQQLETTAILLRTQQEVQRMSQVLAQHHIVHFSPQAPNPFLQSDLQALVQHFLQALTCLSCSADTTDLTPSTFTTAYQQCCYDLQQAFYKHKVTHAMAFRHLWQAQYKALLACNHLQHIAHFDSITQWLLQQLMQRSAHESFSQQLYELLFALPLMPASTLWHTGLMQVPLSVMTTQEAKGLEFDNVLLCNATADVYPLFYLSDKSEDARLLYVGMSRARKRLFVSYIIEPSYYLASPRVYNRFYELPDIQKHLLIKMERRIAEASALCAQKQV